MLRDLQIHICVQTFRKITDLKHMLVIVLLPHLSSSLWLVSQLIPNYVFHCISLHCISKVDLQWVPRCSENKLELWKSELQCDVSSTFWKWTYCVPIVTSIHKSSQMSHKKQLKHSLQLGNPSFLKEILFPMLMPKPCSGDFKHDSNTHLWKEG